MVGTLLRLRFRVLANTLARNPFQLVAVILGGVLAALMLLLALGGLLVASTAPPEATQAVVVVGGTALVLGWLIVPLLFDGVDRTLDPPKLARFPLRTGQLMLAMFLVGATWVPGILTIVGSIATAIAWRAHPVSAGVAVVTGLHRGGDMHRGLAAHDLGGRHPAARTRRRADLDRRARPPGTRGAARARGLRRHARRRAGGEIHGGGRGARLDSARSRMVGRGPSRPRRPGRRRSSPSRWLSARSRVCSCCGAWLSGSARR